MQKLPSLLLLSALLVLCASQWETEAKPIKKPYLGLEGLEKPMWTDGHRKAEHHFEHYDPLTRRGLKLHYTTELAENVIHLDDVKDLEEIISPKENHLFLNFSSSDSRDSFQSTLHKGDLLAGGIHWGCRMKNGVRSILAKVIDVSADYSKSNSSLLIQTEPSSHPEFFKHADVKFSTSVFVPSGARTHPKEPHISRSKRGIIGGFPFGIVKQAIDDVVSFASDVAQIVETVAKDATKLIKGQFNASGSEEFTIFNFNYNPSTHSAKETLQNGPVTCENCFAYLDVDLTFEFLVQDFSVKLFNVTLGGSATGVMNDVTIDLLDENQSFSWPIATLDYDPITIPILGIPFVLSPSLPVTMEANIQATGEATVGVNATISVSTAIGFAYTPEDGTIPIEASSFDAQGGLKGISYEAQTEATVGITFTPTISIDYFIVVSAGFNPYVALTANGKIAEMVTSLPEGSMSWNLGYGLQISIGGSIPLLDAEWTPYTYQSGITPITNGLLSFNDDYETWEISPAHIVTVGNTYYGYQQPVYDSCDNIPYGNLTLQVTNQTGPSDYQIMLLSYLVFGEPNAGYWDVVVCLLQAEYDMTVSGLTFTASPYGHDYYWACTSDEAEVSPGDFSGTFGDDTYSAFDSVFFDGCGYLYLETASS